MADKPIQTALPADLPINWVSNQIVSPNGTDVGLTQQHGYNYLSQAVNSAQTAINTINDAFTGLATTENAVPNTRTVNGYPLSSDITLTSSDVGAVPTTRTVNAKALSADITLSADDVGAVPAARTVNGKALSSDITLSAGDVGAMPTAGGAFTGQVTAGGGQAVGTAQVRNIYAGTADLTAGSSALATGALYFVYE